MAEPRSPVTNAPHQIESCPVEYKLVIPTKGRWRPAKVINPRERAIAHDNTPFILRKTLAVLDQQEMDVYRVTLFVNSEEEKDKYQEALKESRWEEVRIIIGVDGILEQRNFISRYFPEGTHIVSLDDDLEKLWVKTVPNSLSLEELPPKGLENIIFDAEKRMRAYKKAHLWGLNPTASKNVRNMKVDGISTRNGEVNGFLYGYRNRHDPDLYPQFSNATEDAERSVRYFAKDGIVLRYRMYCCETRCYENGAGLQANFGQNDISETLDESNENRKRAELESARKIHEAFPMLVGEPREREHAKTLSMVFRIKGGAVIPSTTIEELKNHCEEVKSNSKKLKTDDENPKKKRKLNNDHAAGLGMDDSEDSVETSSQEDDKKEAELLHQEEEQLFNAIDQVDDKLSGEERILEAWFRSYNGNFENPMEEAVKESYLEESKRLELEKKEQEELARVMRESAEAAAKDSPELVVIENDQEEVDANDENAEIYKAIEESKKLFEADNEQKVQQILSMGFPRDLCLKAINTTNGNVESALEWIFSQQ